MEFYFNEINENFMNSQEWSDKLNNYIEQLESMITNQNNIDTCYNCLCKILTDEMDSHLKFSDASSKIKRKHENSKPYWCEEL